LLFAEPCQFGFGLFLCHDAPERELRNSNADSNSGQDLLGLCPYLLNMFVQGISEFQ
jgi:hypothetical protein